MGLLKSVNDVQGIDYYEYRDSQFYSKYNYRARFTVPGIRYCWYSDTATLKQRLAGNKGVYSRIPSDERKIILSNLPVIEAFIEFRDKAKKNKEIGIRSESNTVAVFSNDLQYLKSLESMLGPDSSVDYTEAITANLVGVKHFVNEPKFKYRVYLKSQRAPDGFKKEMKEFLAKHKKTISPSPSLAQWIKDKGINNSYWWENYVSSHYFMEYNDESTLSYLALIYGNMLGKRYKLEKRPDPV